MALVVYSAAAPNVEDQKRSPSRLFRFGEEVLTIQQRWRPDGKGGTALGFGASVFDAAYVLGDYLFRHSDTVRGKRVLELGAGTGLTALAAWLAGAREVVATDGDAELLTSLTDVNLEANVAQAHARAGQGAESPPQGKIYTAPLFWGNQEQERALGPPFDVVFAADCAACVYEEAFDALIDTMYRMAAEGAAIFLGYHRRHHSEGRFFERVEKSFELQSVPREQLHPDFARTEAISIFTLHRRPREEATSDDGGSILGPPPPVTSRPAEEGPSSWSS